MERLTPEHSAQKQTIGFESVTRLDDLADGIICPVHRHRMDHEIMPTRIQRQ